MLFDANRDAPRYIVIEGPIGVGKTTLVKKLAEKYDARTVLEVFEENPFLADFYGNRDQYAFQTEMFFLLSRYRQQEQFAQDDLFGRLSVSDYLFTKCRLFASLTLSDHELTLYDRMYSILSTQVPKPDVVIHLHAPLDTLLDRIRKRGRAYERNMDREYLERLRSLYMQFFQHYEETPLLEIDTSELDFTQDEEAVELVMHKASKVIREAYKPRPAIEF
jgi:deoxyadenosine/deoxycytidine kinase